MGEKIKPDDESYQLTFPFFSEKITSKAKKFFAVFVPQPQNSQRAGAIFLTNGGLFDVNFILTISNLINNVGLKTISPPQ